MEISLADLTELVERAKQDLTIQDNEYSNYPDDEDFAFMSRVMTMVGQDPAAWFRAEFSCPPSRPENRPAWCERFLAEWAAARAAYLAKCEASKHDGPAGVVCHGPTSSPDRGI